MTSVTDRSDQVLRTLRRLMRGLDIQSRHIMRTAGLTGPQLLVLQSAARNGPLTVGQLATTIELTQATVTPILDRLERKQLIRRDRGLNDKRKVFITLTELGRRTLAGAPALMQEHFVRSFSQLDDSEQARLLAALQQVADMMQPPAPAMEVTVDSLSTLADSEFQRSVL